MFYLGIDQSLREPALAWMRDDRIEFAAALRVSAKLTGAKRLAEIQEWVRAVVPKELEARVALEGPSLGSTHREFDLGEVSGVIRCFSYTFNRLEPLVVAPLQVKKFATGTTGATKQDVIDAVKKTWAYETDNDNIADAIVIAQICRSFHTGQALTRAQHEVIFSLKNPKK